MSFALPTALTGGELSLFVRKRLNTDLKNAAFFLSELPDSQAELSVIFRFRKSESAISLVLQPTKRARQISEMLVAQ